MVIPFRVGSLAMAEFCHRRSNGAESRRNLVILRLSATTPTRQAGPGIIAPIITSQPIDQGSPRGTVQHGGEIGYKHGINDFGRLGNGGPCPSHHQRPHQYHFRILALSLAHLPVESKPSCADIEQAARKHVFVEASIVRIVRSMTEPDCELGTTASAEL